MRTIAPSDRPESADCHCFSSVFGGQWRGSLRHLLCERPDLQFLSNDGVALAFDRLAGDKTTIVMIHGWCCDHEYLAPQSCYFVQRNHPIVAVDLRGHGQSDKPVQAYTISGFADDIAWLCGELQLSKAIIIGHSMGGIVAFDFAVRYPALAAAIVMIDSAVIVPQGARLRLPGLIESLQRSDYRTALSDYISSALLLPTDDKARSQWILDRMTSAPQHVMVEGLRDYDPDELGLRLAVPSLYIAADEPVARCDMSRLQELAPHLMHGRTVGSGHFCQLEVADQVNAMIERFMALSPV